MPDQIEHGPQRRNRDVIPLRRAERLAQIGAVAHDETHRVDRAGGDGDRTAMFSQPGRGREHLVVGLRDSDVEAIHQVGPIDGDLGGGVGRKAPDAAAEMI